MIAVSRGASLDPDLSQPPTTSYFLEVIEVLTVMVTMIIIVVMIIMMMSMKVIIDH